MRSEDRNIHAHNYPALHYPELYLLEGGYKALFEHSTVGLLLVEFAMGMTIELFRNFVNRIFIELCWMNNFKNNADNFDPFPNNPKNSLLSKKISVMRFPRVVDVHVQHFVRVSPYVLRVHRSKVKSISLENLLCVCVCLHFLSVQLFVSLLSLVH